MLQIRVQFGTILEIENGVFGCVRIPSSEALAWSPFGLSKSVAFFVFKCKNVAKYRFLSLAVHEAPVEFLQLQADTRSATCVVPSSCGHLAHQSTMVHSIPTSLTQFRKLTRYLTQSTLNHPISPFNIFTVHCRVNPGHMR